MSYPRHLLTFLFLFLAVSVYAQPRPGFFYHYPPKDNTSGRDISPFVDGKFIVYNYLHDPYFSGSGFLLEDDDQCFTILDSTASSIDTTIYLNDDTSSTYNYDYIDQVVVDDTAYFLFNAHEKDSTGFSQRLATNLVFFKMDKNYNLGSAKTLFPADTMEVLYSADRHVKYNDELKLFEMFFMKYDTVQEHGDVLLIRFDRTGELRYSKEWAYTVDTFYLPNLSDHQALGNGRYLLTQRLTNNIYVIADTAEPEIDTSYFKPEIRKLTTIREKDDSYIMMGMSDGHKIISLEDGKLQYVFLELDKQNLQEKSRHKYKIKDTLTFNRIEAQVFRNAFHVLPNGDYMFAVREVFYDPNGVATPPPHIVFTSIYRMDSAANIIWKYRMADTTHNDLFGGATLDPIPGTDEFIWHNVYYNYPATPDLGYTWVMKFKADGSNLSIDEQELEQMESFRLYPNPVKDRFMLLLPFLPDDEVRVNIYTMGGELVQQETFNMRDNLLEIATGLKRGNYLVEVSSEQYRASRKLVVSE